MKQGEPSKMWNEWIEQTTYRGAVLREQHLRVLIQPRPLWVPEWVWRKVLARVLVIVEGQPSVAALRGTTEERET